MRLTSRWILILSVAATVGCSSSLSNEQILLTSQQIARMLHETYTAQPDIQHAPLDRFPLLDPTYYQTMTETLKQEGFEWIGDLELKHISRRDLAFKTCMRTFVSSDKTIYAAVWQFHKSPQTPRDLRM